MSVELLRLTSEALPLLQAHAYKLQGGDCNLSIASLISRSDEYLISYAMIEEELVLRWKPYAETPFAWVVPWSSEKIIDILRTIEEDCMEHCEPLVLYGTYGALTRNVESLMPYRNFMTASSNAWWDYLYDRESFVKLEGRKLHGKRNFVKRFKNAHPEAELIAITEENIPQCIVFLERWYASQEEMTPGLINESKAIHTAFENWSDFELEGGMLVQGEEVFGFTYGSKVRDDMFAVHIEKADRSVTGSYPALAVEFAANLPESVTFINREEDLGIAGLRKAKQDWFPTDVVRKTILSLEKEKEFGSNCKVRKILSCRSLAH